MRIVSDHIVNNFVLRYVTINFSSIL